MKLSDHRPAASAADAWPERGKHDKEGRQRALLDAATTVFARHGYDVATTREIADMAGCSEGLIHRYFGGKHGLLVASLHVRADEVTAQFRDQVRPQPTVEAEVHELLMACLRHAWECRDSMRVSISQSVIDSEVGETIGHHFNDARAAIISERLERHRAAGRIRPDVDLDAAAHAISGCGFAMGFMAQVVFATDRAVIERRAAAFAEVVARGISSDFTPPASARKAESE